MLRLPASLGAALRLIGSGFGSEARLIAARDRFECDVIASPAQPGVAIQSDGLLRQPFWFPRNDGI